MLSKSKLKVSIKTYFQDFDETSKQHEREDELVNNIYFESAMLY